MRRRLLVGGGLLAALCVAVALARGGGRDTPWRRTAERLATLPYVDWSDSGGGGQGRRSGTLRLDAERAAPGVNLYASEVEPGAWVVDLEGRRVHRFQDRREEPTNWKLVKPLPDGTFAALVAGGTILAFDARSRLLWEVTSGFHHDFDVAADGRLYAPAFRTRRLAALSRVYPIRDDGLEIWGPDRRLERRLSFGELVAREPELLAAARAHDRRLLDWRLDLLHTNTVEVLERDVAWPAGPRWPAGSVLVCWRNLDTVAVVDPRSEEILWHWGRGVLERPHQPTLLADGRLLVFDNGSRRGWSRVLEVDPPTGRILWEYTADPPASFFTASRGAAQRLANGNTLIVESGSGRAFEVTPAGDVVWEYLDPRLRDPWFGPPERATIYRMQRLAPENLD
jgi:hypothetical protein